MQHKNTGPESVQKSSSAAPQAAGKGRAVQLKGKSYSEGQAALSPVQMFRRGGEQSTDPPAFKGWRIGETGSTAVSQETGEGGYNLWATPDRITDANSKLKSAGSGIELVNAKNAKALGSKTLAEVRPSLRQNVTTPQDDKLKKVNRGDIAADDGSKTNDKLGLWTDCGRASRVVTGGYVGGKYKKGGKTETTAASGNPASYSDEIYLQTMPEFINNAANRKYLVKGVHYNEGAKGEFQPILPTTSRQARAMYTQLAAGGEMAYSTAFGINYGANPEIGQTYTMATEYDMPGYAEHGFTWNFHWAGVIMKDGSDNITLEGYAIDPSRQLREARQKYNKPADRAKLQSEIARIRKWAAEYVDRDFRIQMYGTTNKNQTFQHEHDESKTHGTRNSTFVAGKQ